MNYYIGTQHTAAMQRARRAIRFVTIVFAVSIGFAKKKIHRETLYDHDGGSVGGSGGGCFF